MAGIAIVNGKLVDPSAPAISVFDAAVLHGDAYFETLRTYGGRPALLTEHLERLESAIELAGFPDPPSASQLEAEVAAAVNEFSEGEVGIRVTVSRGVREAGLTAEPESTTRIITARLITSSAAGEDATVDQIEIPGYAYPHKSANYQWQAAALRGARAAGFDEVLISDGGELIEGATSNIFVIRGDELATPALGRCLPGITRQAVLDLAGDVGLNPVERTVMTAELESSDGVFLTNSLIELRAVTNLGAASPRIAELRRALLDRYAEDAA
ncbi:MAG: aminotransferase class IV [Thermoleophilaceae bacterium]|nr:aminotransferase class IV [Thermoleophilaceae bacterium]